MVDGVPGLDPDALHPWKICAAADQAQSTIDYSVVFLQTRELATANTRFTTSCKIGPIKD